jgi:hypothetical protein
LEKLTGVMVVVAKYAKEDKTEAILVDSARMR